MAGAMILRIWDVEHGACAMLRHLQDGRPGRLAMIDSGDKDGWAPASFIKDSLGLNQIDYLYITNADQDHMSGLQNLWDGGITVSVMGKNPSMNATVFEQIKRKSGPLTRDAQRYKTSLGVFTNPVDEPFNDHMGGITRQQFWLEYPAFDDTNNLSLVVFIQYRDFGILFPGDLEVAGWTEHLKNPAFREMLGRVTIFCASHHGRFSGYCEKVFDYCRPQAIVMSDKSIVHGTQEGMTALYRGHVRANWPNGVVVATTGKNRRVLTTRRDGWIEFEVDDASNFGINTEYQG